VSIFADRLKQFSLVGMVGLINPGSSAELLRLSLFMHLPMLFLAPLFGALLDRWNKSGVITIVDMLRAFLVLAIPIAYTKLGSIYAIYLPVLVISMADLLFAPARSALIPALCEPRRLLHINAVFWGLGIVGTLAGFLLGGWLFDYRSWQGSFQTDAASYAVAALFMLPVLLLRRGQRSAVQPKARRRPTIEESVKEVARSIVEGIVLIRQKQHIGVWLITQSALFALGGFIYVIAIARIQELFPPGKTIYLSVVTTCFLAGLLLGSWIAGAYRDRTASQRTIAVATLLTGVSIVGIGRTETIVPMSVWTVLLGLAISPVFILTETLLQSHIPEDFRGRVFSTREVMIKAAFLGVAVVATAVNTLVSKATMLMSVGLFLAMLGVVLERSKWLKIQKDPRR
jgi:MFS family permease